MAERRQPVSMQLRAQVRWIMNRGCELVAHVIGDLFRAASGRAVFLDHQLQQRFQNFQAAMAHASWARTRLESGRRTLAWNFEA